MDTNKIFKKIIRNKAGDKILSVYWFAILIIVAGGLFGMVYVFYGTPYDVREIETKLMIDKIADCVSYAGRINPNLISQGTFDKNFNLSTNCHLILNSEEWGDEQYYIEFNFYKIDNLNNPVFKTSEGNNNLLTSCEVQQDKEYSRLAKCQRGSFYSIDSSNNQYIIKILASVRKAEKNVKI